MARCYYLDYISKGCLSSYDSPGGVCLQALRQARTLIA